MTCSILALLCWAAYPSCADGAEAARAQVMRSPGGHIEASVRYDGALNLSVQLDGKTAMADSPAGLQLDGEGGDLAADLKLVAVRDAKIDETYALPHGKTSTCVNRANEKVLTFENPAGRRMDLVLRLYDDGVAYRYRLSGEGPVKVLRELSGFHMPDGSDGWLQPYTANYEQFYKTGKSGVDFKDGEWGLPALFHIGESAWVLVTEAAVYGDYCASHLSGSGANGTYRLRFAGDAPAAALPLQTPWRVIIAGPTLASIVESVMVENLNPPSEIADTSWIKPGRVAWSWWSNPRSARSLETQKQYVDFAAEMGWEYSLVDAGWNSQWVPELVQYATAKGVGILLWNRWNTMDTPEKRQQLGTFKSWGVAGVKVDFMDSDAQERMKFYDDMTVAAMQHRLMINYHGARLPQGQQRRWPHIMTQEGVLGAEHYNFKMIPSPEHNCTLPFTRNAVGPMDYTPVTFSAKTRRTTMAHELALSVVFESAWQHMADSPDSYRACGAVDFLKAVPATWDETRFIDGYPGQYVVLARRKGAEWYVGGINAGDARSVQIQFGFLDGAWKARVYGDGPDGRIVAEDTRVGGGGMLKLMVTAHGGFAVRLSR